MIWDSSFWTPDSSVSRFRERTLSFLCLPSPACHVTTIRRTSPPTRPYAVHKRNNNNNPGVIRKVAFDHDSLSVTNLRRVSWGVGRGGWQKPVEAEPNPSWKEEEFSVWTDGRLRRRRRRGDVLVTDLTCCKVCWLDDGRHWQGPW